MFRVSDDASLFKQPAVPVKEVPDDWFAQNLKREAFRNKDQKHCHSIYEWRLRVLGVMVCFFARKQF